MILSNGHCQQVKWSSPSLAGWVDQLIRASQESDTPLAYWPNTREQSILSMIECIYPNIDQISTWLVYSHQVYLCLYNPTITEKTARILTHDHCRYILAFGYYFPIYHPLLFGPLNPFCEKNTHFNRQYHHCITLAHHEAHRPIIDDHIIPHPLHQLDPHPKKRDIEQKFY